MFAQSVPYPHRLVAVLMATFVALSALLWPAASQPAWASDYQGDTIQASDGKGYFAVVRDSGGSIVWGSKKKFKKEERAQKKADKKAEQMNSGVIDDCWTNPDLPGCGDQW